MRTLLSRATGTLAVAALLTSGAWAQVRTFSINFNDVAPGTAVNTTYEPTTGAVFSLQNDPVFGQVIADNPGFPANPDPAFNALSGVDGPIVYSDSQGFFISTFTFDVVVDPSGFGVNNALVSFLGGDGSVVSTLTIDQTVAGTYTYTRTTPNVAVSVVLPGDAFYDNISATVAAPEPGPNVAAPEPATLGLLTGGLVIGGLRARRRK